MPNPFDKYGVSDAELAKAISQSAEVDAGLRESAREIVDYWKSIAPVDEGEYAASVKVQGKPRGGKVRVGSKHWKAHLLEFGTGADTKGPEKRRVPTNDGFATLGKDTKTPAFGTGQQVAEHFGGNLTGDGIEVDE
ncbi:minor tail protein [Mycobacterium phage Cornie]|uniref:Head-to-tail connector protein n=1 Tax=Mycobacterium phage Cornie TaxID=2704043 RepID=A0A6G6XJW5_9CAUD|nr:minor tail protein [Mycobacterium phage Cornie]QIG58388.1 hypothetical protein SEA_CORNIE_10 [Mycobacterium phage Cornie]